MGASPLEARLVHVGEGIRPNLTRLRIAVLLINRDTARATENAAYALVPTVTIGRPHGQVHDDDRYAADDDR
jgi:hypothetical protein